VYLYNVSSENCINGLVVKCQCVAFHDVNPQAPVHFLVIPKQPLTKLSESEDSDEQVFVNLTSI